MRFLIIMLVLLFGTLNDASATALTAASCKPLCEATKNTQWKKFTAEEKTLADACVAQKLCVADSNGTLGLSVAEDYYLNEQLRRKRDGGV